MLALQRTPTGWPGSLQLFRRDLDDVFRRFWPENQQEMVSFPVDIHEDENGFHIEAELPGFTKDQVHIELEDGVLSISAEKKEETENQKESKYHVQERSYSQVCRRFTMPTGIDPSKVDAKMDNGVLYVNVGKSEQAQARRITVE
ncbi:MAG: Hsp20/alpha crystallin family protein [Planctomycetia bacterium]